MVQLPPRVIKFMVDHTERAGKMPRTSSRNDPLLYRNI
jgi:hypothetical protein